jgi:flagellar protein FlaG
MYVQASTIDPAASARTSGGAAVRDTTSSTAAQVGAAAQPAANADQAEEHPHAVRSAVKAINRAAKALTNTVQLVMDERSEHAIVKVVDSETGQLIRQIPNEEVLELRRALDRISGLLINRTA